MEGNNINRAKRFAMAFHGRYKCSEVLYVTHLDNVCEVLTRFGYNSRKLKVAAYLHDILEDTQVTRHVLAIEFGDDVASLVQAVTDSQGASRKEKKAGSYTRIRNHGVDAIVLKVADRIANVEDAIRRDAKVLFRMYKKEYGSFRFSLQVDDGNPEEMWTHLDGLMKTSMA